MRSSFTPRLGLLTFGHFTIDSYSSFFAPLLPLLVEKLDLNLTMVGTLVALASVTSSFSQPLFGIASDRLRRPWFVAFGPLVAALFMSGLGLAPNYAALVALLMFAGLGVAAFHPQSAALVMATSERRGMAMAIFVTGGTIGFSIGPIFAVGIVSAFGLERTWIAAIPGVIVSGLLLSWFTRVVPRARHDVKPAALHRLRPIAWPLSLLYVVTVARSAVSYGFMTYLPLYLTGRGYTLSQSAAIVSTYLLLGSFGGFLGGWLSDRVGGPRVILASFLAATPFYYAFLVLPDRAGLPCLIAGSFLLQTSLPVNVVAGQELSPEHSSTIASLLMGAAWGFGALIVGPIGAFSDRQGLHAGLAVLSGMLVVGIVGASLFLRARTRAIEPAPLLGS